MKEDLIIALKGLIKNFDYFQISEEWEEEVCKLMGLEDIHDLCDDPYYYDIAISWYIKGLEYEIRVVNDGRRN